MPNHLIKPREPTVLSHKEYHEVSSTNLLLSATVSTAHVVPEILDVERFNIALSKALSSFPHLAGRLVRPGIPHVAWMIRLTNSGVPLSVVDSDADKIVATDFTAQTPFRLVEPLNVTGIVNTEGESDEPLFRLTITRFTRLNSTAIGACTSHVLFDGSGFLLFLNLLSQFYQALEPVDLPLYYEPEAIKFPDPPKDSPSIFELYDPSGQHPCELPERKAMEFVALRLTATQLAEVHGTVTQGKEDLRISRVDVVVGLLARCLSEVEPESKPIDTILNVVNHRGMGIYPDNAVVNAIIWLPAKLQVSKLIDPHDNVLAWATKIRESLGRLKDPGFVKDMAAGVAKMQSQVAWDRKGQDIPTAKEGCLIVNNTWKVGWTSPHFGHPGKVMFHHGHPPGSRYIKIMAPNPVFVDGAWIGREGDMELTFYVPQNRRRKFEELFEGYAKILGMAGRVEFLA